ncbi:tRNA-splicing endonuclease subunit Sen15 [Coniella lustricola]|uniref:tRNA-splicing endonuclease subunit Sen15 n=1 Tax=Coniella lustricola TaxID=2025994 RepID=A0A2T3AN22_9PEZI|nr:tRNA-splicing endonuclease subunit Sen15 [Coniella lustricola]
MAFPPHVDGLAKVVLNNLENQQDWTNVTCHADSSLPRPLISGLSPRRMYVHPDEQIDIIKAEKTLGQSIPREAEYEWVLPVHLSEKMSLEAFAAVFDSIDALPPGAKAHEDLSENCSQWRKWRGSARGKRVLMAVVHDDSTVVYYMMHDGIVKPRQN